jgi:hypothetical protein
MERRIIEVGFGGAEVGWVATFAANHFSGPIMKRVAKGQIKVYEYAVVFKFKT